MSVTGNEGLLQKDRTMMRRLWTGMLARCHNPKNPQYKRYGARGIRVCDKWHEFESYLADVWPRPSMLHSMDRYPDNDGPYAPENFRWATSAQQHETQIFGYYVLHEGIPLTVRQFTAINQMKTTDVVAGFRSGSLIECCKEGHPFTADNIYAYAWRHKTFRMCKTCRYVQNRKIAARKQAAAGGRKQTSIRTLPPHLARNLGSTKTVDF